MDIVIVGGGTAGWISAFFIAKAQPGEHNITVIESSSIGIIGAGEGSTGSLLDVLNGNFFDFKTNINDFISKTDATHKMGIRHINWGKNKESYFAPLDVSPTAFELEDYIFKYVFSKYGKEKIHLASKIGIEYENKKYDTPYALHFDGHKVGKYFKSLCVPDGVKVIDDIVVDADINSDGEIEKIVLETGKIVHADFFIDCSGFHRTLMKKLNVEWESYQDILSVDTAMPFILPYDNDEEFVPETKATALSAGWMWTIPLQTRKGCGYVFDSKYISREDAQKEVEDFLGKKVEPIKWIEFDSGFSKEFWTKNVICLGLASAFVEPLEATSIHNTIVQLAIFVKQFLKKDKTKTITEVNQKIYNQRMRFLNKLTIDFISLHYKGERSDSEFWKSVNNKKLSKEAQEILNVSKDKIPNFVLLEGMYGSWSIPLLNWIFAGIDILSPEQALEELNTTSVDIEYIEKMYNEFTRNIIKNKSYLVKL